MDRAYAVIDDFLTPREHQNLWDAFQTRGPDWNRTYEVTNATLRDCTDSPSPPALRVFTEALFAAMRADTAPLALDPWGGFTQSAWVYRPGEGLAWHSDTGWIGAYIYYVHPDWQPSWGGELRMEDASVAPSPNRLVLVRGGTRHCITPVERAAGEAYRASVSGFFHA
jgi:hypothetical protein